MTLSHQISLPEPRAARAADTPNTAALDQLRYRTLHPTDSGHSPAAAMGDHLRGTSGGRVPGSISTLRMVTKGENVPTAAPAIWPYAHRSLAAVDAADHSATIDDASARLPDGDGTPRSEPFFHEAEHA